MRIVLAVTETVPSVGSCLADLSGCPRIPTVAGDRDHDRPRGKVPAAEGRVADVHVPKERARRGIVRPDLLFVSEQGSVLLGNKLWLHPGVLISCCCCRCVVGARDVSRGNASERIAKGKRDGGIVEPRTVRPREAAIRIWARTKCHGRVAESDQTVL